jgi:hypothetical protein
MSSAQVSYNVSGSGPRGFVLLGLQWHAKLVQRVELTGMMINAYDCHIDSARSTGELDYWLGGLIAMGVGPQPEVRGSAAGQYDQLVGVWMRRYLRYGHLQEAQIQTLHYDTSCCHIQGVCQWVPCADIVAVGLGGGLLPAKDGAVVGVYAGSSKNVTVPLSALSAKSSSTVVSMLLFVAHGVESTQLSFGAPSNSSSLRQFRLVPLSPPTNVTVVLEGGWWDLRGENVRLTVEAEGSPAGGAGRKVISTAMLWPEAQTGPRVWRGVLGQQRLTTSRPTLVFDKVAQAE